jgi:hypothetical protein
MPDDARLAVGAAAIGGLPPLNGFASEWLTFQGLLGAGADEALSPVARSASLLAIGGLGLTAALAVACFVKATGVGFLALPRSAAAAGAHETSRWMGGPMLALARLRGGRPAPVAPGSQHRGGGRGAAAHSLATPRGRGLGGAVTPPERSGPFGTALRRGFRDPARPQVVPRGRPHRRRPRSNTSR